MPRARAHEADAGYCWSQGTSTEKNRQQLEVYVNQLLFDANFVKDPEVLRFFEIKPVAESPQSTPVTSPQQQPKQHTAPQHEERNGHDSMVAPAHPQHQVDGASQHHGDRQVRKFPPPATSHRRGSPYTPHITRHLAHGSKHISHIPKAPNQGDYLVQQPHSALVTRPWRRR